MEGYKLGVVTNIELPCSQCFFSDHIPQRSVERVITTVLGHKRCNNVGFAKWHLEVGPSEPPGEGEEGAACTKKMQECLHANATRL
jgi:hypothetical protein